DDNGKWPAVTTATKAFFGDQSTAGLSASLSFFPLHENNSDQGNLMCKSSDYTPPKVPMTALPSGTFAPIIDGTTRLSDTPTLPALQGALAYAKQVEAGGTKAAVVLVTDGEPN